MFGACLVLVLIAQPPGLAAQEQADGSVEIRHRATPRDPTEGTAAFLVLTVDRRRLNPRLIWRFVYGSEFPFTITRLTVRAGTKAHRLDLEPGSVRQGTTADGWHWWTCDRPIRRGDPVLTALLRSGGTVTFGCTDGREDAWTRPDRAKMQAVLDYYDHATATAAPR